MKKLTFHICVC